MLVDTHCHLGDPAFAAEVAEVVARAGEAGVGHLVVVGDSVGGTERAIELAGQFEGLSATAGVHPHAAAEWSPEAADWLAARLRHPLVVAAGEMGLDYHYDHAPRERQREAFDAQLDLAGQAGKPAVIHAREADADVADLLDRHPGTVAILHSWSSGERLLEAALRLNHYVSFSGMVTFRSWKDDAAISRVPEDRLLVETDSPYLAPVPHRGKRNEPGYLTAVARRLAEVRGLSYQAICELTTANAVRVFGPRLLAPTRSPA